MDPGGSIRSLASRGHLGGLSASAARVADLVDAAGLDVIVLETVGARQSEVEMAEMADVRIVVSAPGLGMTFRRSRQIFFRLPKFWSSTNPICRWPDGLLALRAPGVWKVPVLATNAVDRAGLSELSDAVERKAETRETRGPPDALGGREKPAFGGPIITSFGHCCPGKLLGLKSEPGVFSEMSSPGLTHYCPVKGAK